MRAAILLLLLALAGCATNGAVGTPAGPWRDQTFRVPEHFSSGPAIALTMRVCRPRTDAAARAVVINHATPDDDASRQVMLAAACTSEVAQWFLARGYVVALPLRRGHGAPGPLAESPGPCATPNDVQAGLAGAADIAAVVDDLATLPFVQPNRMVVIGEGSGGWATTAYDSLPHPRVSALVSVAGSPAGPPCRADLLAYSAAYYATASNTPMLWIYAANDPVIPPKAAGAIARSYQTAGGALQLEQVGRFGADGRTLLSGLGGSALWGKLIDHYLSNT